MNSINRTGQRFIEGFLFCAVVFFALPAVAQTTPTVYNTNAGWCWFQDERALIVNNQLIFTSVACTAGTNGTTRSGDIDVTTVNLSSMTSSVFTLHDNLGNDDHDAAGLMVKTDGTILAVYCTHGADSYVRYRSTVNAGDTTSWTTEQSINVNSNYGATYDNLYYMSDSGLTYDFYRGQDYQPNLLISSDQGSTWTMSGKLIKAATGVRPYVKYVSDGKSRVYFSYTTGHPRDVVSSVYCAYTENSLIYDMRGTLIGTVSTGTSSGINVAQGTTIYDATANNNYDGWCTDLILDRNNKPILGYTVKNSNDDHRYRYAKWDGTQWNDHEIAYAGKCLYTAENDYTGLITINANDVNTVYIATDVDPVTGATLTSSADGKQHWEVYRGFTNDGGTSWLWTAVTANSTADNIRPLVPAWDTTHTSLTWMKGTYTTYLAYDMDAVGYVFEGSNGIWSNAAGGVWSASSTSNWQDGLVGHGQLGVADFSTVDVSGTAVVQLASDLTIGTMVFGDAGTATTGQWAVTPSGSAKLKLENVGVAAPEIKTNARSLAAINVTLSGSQGLSVTGSGTLLLAAANTYSGTTTLNGGTLRTANASALGSASDQLVIAGRTGTAKLEIAAGTQLNKAITLNGRGATPGLNLASHIVGLGGQTVLNGNVSMAVGGYDYIIESASGTLTVNGNVTNNTANTAARYIHLVGEGDGTLNGTISNGTGTGAVSLLKDGTGTWTLAKDLVISGSVTVSDGQLTAAGMTASNVSVAGEAVLVVDTLVADSLVLGSTGATASASGAGLPEDEVSSATTVAVPEPTVWAGLTVLAGIALANIRRRK